MNKKCARALCESALRQNRGKVSSLLNEIVDIEERAYNLIKN